MWFNNCVIYQYETDSDILDISQQLADAKLKPCPPHARVSHGWLPAYADEMVHEIAGAKLICLGKEERILPKAVITKTLNERVEQWEANNQRPMSRSDKAQLAEELEFELLPKAFTLQKRQLALFDTECKRLIINTASSNQAAQVLSLLRKQLPGISFNTPDIDNNLALQLSQWISEPSTLPQQFELASDCKLFAMDDEKKQFNCKGYELPADEVLTLLSQGLATAEISLIWQDRIQFTLTHNFTLKRLKCLDYLVESFNEAKQHEEEYEQRDAALTLMSQEVRALVNELLSNIKTTSDSDLAYTSNPSTIPEEVTA